MKLFETPPSAGQFALNGMWEDALSFKVHKPPSAAEIKAYIADRNELAFEMFFGELFFGVRFFGTAAFILELSQHCLRCLKISWDAASFIKAVGNHALTGELCHKVAHIEVGAVNAWKSIGSFRLPPLTQASANVDALWSRICDTSLAKDNKHPKAIELAYSDPLPHWIGFPISVQQSPYRLNKEMFVDVFQNYYWQEKRI